MFKTAITEMFGVKYPVICGAMQWLCTPQLCAAISNAGGLGNLTAGNYETEEDFRAAIEETKKMTDKPFFVGLTILPSVRITPGHHRMYAEVCADMGVAALEISGAPLDRGIGPDIIDVLKKGNVKMFHKVGAVRHAKHAEKVGYDGVFAAGIEEGGHPLNDDVTTMVLTPRIKSEVKIPVVTVGGIADGRSLAAALILGGDGVMMATRFVATTDCDVHDNIRQELVNRQEFETVLWGGSLGLQGRALKNKIIEEVLEMEEKGAGFEALYPLIAGDRIKNAWEHGNVEDAPLMVGQSIGLIHDVMSCQELLDDMGKEAAKILKETAKIVS